MQVFCMIFFRLWIWAAKGSATNTRKSIENPKTNPNDNMSKMIRDDLSVFIGGICVSF